MQALSLAGGLTTFAAQDEIRILRRDATGKQRALKFSYSDVEVVSLGQLDENALKIYPNPSKDLMTIEANVVELSDFAVYNIYGQNVMNLLKITDQNTAAITIDISRLADGVYTLKTRNYVSKIIKQ